MRAPERHGDESGGDHLFPFRTEKLKPPAPMVLRLKRGRVGRRRPYQAPGEPGAFFLPFPGRLVSCPVASRAICRRKDSRPSSSGTGLGRLPAAYPSLVRCPGSFSLVRMAATEKVRRIHFNRWSCASCNISYLRGDKPASIRIMPIGQAAVELLTLKIIGSWKNVKVLSPCRVARLHCADLKSR